MIPVDLLVTGIGELATLASGPVPRVGDAMSRVGVVHDAAFAVRGGRFVFVGTERAARRTVRIRRGGRTWSLDGATVVPGFVDAHTHLLFAGDRAHELDAKIRGASYLEIARRGGGLFSTVRATRRASEREIIAPSLERLKRLAQSGVTTAEVKSGYALSHAGEIRLLRLIPRIARVSRLELVPTFLGAHAVPLEWHSDADGYIDLLMRRTLPVVARSGLARFCDVFCEPGFFSIRQSGRLLRAARVLGLESKIHADEFVATGGARLAAEIHARSADHLLETPRREYARLRRSGVTAVLLPVTPFASLAGGRSPGRELVDAGVAVALGSDLSPNSWVESMPAVLSHAVHGARLTPKEALTAATVNSAHAIGAADRAGQIAIGRSADFAVFDLPSVDHIPYRVGSLPTHVSRQGIPLFSR